MASMSSTIDMRTRFSGGPVQGLLRRGFGSESMFVNEFSTASEGELVLTTLGRAGCPLFRYRTGDLVRAVEKTAEDGLPVLDLEGGILGRSDDMVVIRGVNVYPSAVDAVVRGFAEISEYRVICEKKGEMPEVRLEVEAPEGVAQALESALKEAFSLRVPVGRVEPDSLPRFEMKSDRWLVE